MIDLEAVRADTPGTQQRVHFNNAGAGLMPQQVLDTVKAHLDLEATIGGYEAKAREDDRLQAAYGSVARLIGADVSEIAFAENATVAWQWAFFAQDLKEGDRILTGEAEYAANYIAFLQMAKRTGCVIDVIPSDASGATDVKALEGMIHGRVKLVAITWIPTTLPLGLKNFQASLSTQWGLYAAGSVLVSVPVVVVFILLSRYLVSGLTLGSVKE